MNKTTNELQGKDESLDEQPESIQLRDGKM